MQPYQFTFGSRLWSTLWILVRWMTLYILLSASCQHVFYGSPIFVKLFKRDLKSVWTRSYTKTWQSELLCNSSQHLTQSVLCKSLFVSFHRAGLYNIGLCNTGNISSLLHFGLSGSVSSLQDQHWQHGFQLVSGIDLCVQLNQSLRLCESTLQIYKL